MSEVTIAGDTYDKEPFTPEDANALEVGRTYMGESALHEPEVAMVALRRTSDGFEADLKKIDGTVVQTYQCGDVDKEGGHGNATVKCKTENDCIWRMEWINPSQVKFEWWGSEKEMAGQKQNNPGRDLIILT